MEGLFRPREPQELFPFAEINMKYFEVQAPINLKCTASQPQNKIIDIATRQIVIRHTIEYLLKSINGKEGKERTKPSFITQTFGKTINASPLFFMLNRFELVKFGLTSHKLIGHSETRRPESHPKDWKSGDSNMRPLNW